ncbi:MAG TPA: FecR domain-containing protein [Prolixibacteraceae bacterium]|nr:FecR domain-containing protein [Prolixibacteraceae bacterium]
MNYHIIKKYLEGKSSETESEQVIAWLQDPLNEEESRSILGEIWSGSDIRLTGAKPDFNPMLHWVHHQINHQLASIPMEKTPPVGRRITGFYQIFSRVAAILILPLLILAAYLFISQKNNSGQQANISTREIYTKPGTRIKIDLPDGTQVWLNDGTHFRYPEQFSGSRREVFVDGEAYFEVKSDAQQPFVVNNPMMKTVVTGTHFNINGYVADHFFEATLLEGKVNLERKNQTILLRPGEQVQLEVDNEKIIQKKVHPQNAAAWIEGQLIFKDEKLGTAIRKLARWYNVDIILSDQELGNYLLTGTFQDEKLDQTLTLISLALPVKFKYKKEAKLTDIQRTIYMMKK